MNLKTEVESCKIYWRTQKVIFAGELKLRPEIRKHIILINQTIQISLNNIMQNNRTLNSEQKRIIAEVNQLHFQNFKQYKKNFYNALMKCALNMNNQELYYQCTDAIHNKHNQSEELMKSEMLNYEKAYLQKWQKCSKTDQNCIQLIQNEMRNELYGILQKFYLRSFES